MTALRDAYGRKVIGPPRNAEEEALIAAGATSIIYEGRTFIGVYVDNETGSAPVGSAAQKAQRDAIAEAMVSRLPGKLIVVGLFPSEPGHRIRGCICALQWYPYRGQYDWRALPKGEHAYITQWSFAMPGSQPPTPMQAAQLLALAAAEHPAILLVY